METQTKQKNKKKTKKRVNFKQQYLKLGKEVALTHTGKANFEFTQQEIFTLKEVIGKEMINLKVEINCTDYDEKLNNNPCSNHIIEKQSTLFSVYDKLNFKI